MVTESNLLQYLRALERCWLVDGIAPRCRAFREGLRTWLPSTEHARVRSRAADVSRSISIDWSGAANNFTPATQATAAAASGAAAAAAAACSPLRICRPLRARAEKAAASDGAVRAASSTEPTVKWFQEALVAITQLVAELHAVGDGRADLAPTHRSRS